MKINNMGIKMFIRISWIIALLFVSPMAFAISVCVDENGITSYQHGPCEAKAPSTSNLPIEADKLTDENVLETIERFFKAKTERDPDGAAKFLAGTLEANFESKDDSKKKKTYDKTGYVDLLYLVLTASYRYEADKGCKINSQSAEAYAVQCDVDENLAIRRKEFEGVSDITYTLVLHEGFVKINKIDALASASEKQE